MSHKVMSYAPGMESERMRGDFRACTDYMENAAAEAAKPNYLGERPKELMLSEDKTRLWVFRHKCSFYALRVEPAE